MSDVESGVEFEVRVYEKMRYIGNNRCTWLGGELLVNGQQYGYRYDLVDRYPFLFEAVEGEV